jgi:hypothetical protein
VEIDGNDERNQRELTECRLIDLEEMVSICGDFDNIYLTRNIKPESFYLVGCVPMANIFFDILTLGSKTVN